MIKLKWQRARILVAVTLLLVCGMALLASYSAMAQGGSASWYSINMTGVGNSYLTIGMTGVTNSTLSLNTSAITIEITGVRVYPVSCSFGLLRPGDIRTTGYDFAIYNASNATVDVTIAVSGDWGGSNGWRHSDDCVPDANTAGMVAIIEDENGNASFVIIRKTEPYNYLVTDLEVGETRRFALSFYAPTQFTDYSAKENSVFITVED